MRQAGDGHPQGIRVQGSATTEDMAERRDEGAGGRVGGEVAVFRVLPAWRALYRALDAETAKNTGLASGCRRARLLSRASTVKAAAAASAAAAVGRKGL